jgi:hypothetical protein
LTTAGAVALTMGAKDNVISFSFFGISTEKTLKFNKINKNIRECFIICITFLIYPLPL